MVMIEYLKDKWLTWYTGQSTEERLWRKWTEENIAYRARTIENMFMNFNYIIPVTTQIFNHNEPFGWVPNKQFQQYMYPSRKLGDNAVYYFARGEYNQWDGHFHFNEFGSDQVFVATNNERDAIMITLRWK
jgi:hypothetical protein